ncbi:MAG TPA: polyprenol phosphomannose-dependent alpha 1,6 mannosyltransferase MptB [Pseudonocardiaceae bacterium]|jgi:alpha-1,6-mannosyltransferase|nr:polyprenol phosphomannose-dependent alpha 1,6 mannosyltransferase MptB [Pseudonocardiaceae bacterium]
MTSNPGPAAGASGHALLEAAGRQRPIQGSDHYEHSLLLDRLRTTGLFSGTALLGLIGSLLLAAMAVGAGGILVNDPLIDGGSLSWIRYGHGHDLATVGLYAGVAMLVWAWVRLGRDVLAGTATAQQVTVAGVAWAAPLVLSPPLFTRDVYSYLAQGALALRGLDPYLVGPSKLPPGAVADNVHYVWQTTPAPYGPLFIYIAKMINAATGDHLILGVIGMRLVLLSGFAALVFALPRLAHRLGGNPAVALWLVIANPLTVVHLVGGPHNDLLMIGLLAMGTLLVLEHRHAAGIALGTMAMAIKASAGVVLPFLVWIWATRLPGTRRTQLQRASAGSMVVFATVFAGITLVSGVGLGWIPALDAPSLIVNWMSLPTAAGEVVHAVVAPFGQVSDHPFIMVCRLLGSAVFVAILIRQWWLARNDGPPQTISRASTALLWAALLAPATLPWYFSWALVLGAVRPWPRRTLAWVVTGCTWLVVCTYPTGESAYTSWPYQLAVVAVSLIAGASLLRPDPCGLRARVAFTCPARAGTK